MPWHAKPGCAEHHRAALERMVNALPPELQALPIGLPDPASVRQYRKKKTRGLADARGLNWDRDYGIGVESA